MQSNSTMDIKQMNRLHIPSLDGLRAVSFLLVFAAHAGLQWLIPGGFGVTIFFFLSGYLITTLMRVEEERYGDVSLRRFWLRRALRIAPPFYLVLIIASALSWSHVSGPAFTAQALDVANIWAIFHGFDGFAPGTGVCWSLAIEEHFYVLFPLLFLAMRGLSGGRKATILYTVCAAVLAWRLWLVYGQHASIERTYIGTDTRADSILFGCALAVYGNPMLDMSRLKAWQLKWMALPIALATLLACVLIRSDAFRETFRYSLQGVALTVVFTVVVRYPTWRAVAWLNWRPLVFTGALSYSLYLTHQVVLFAVERYLHGPLAAVVSLAIAFAVSWWIYELVEKPCARARRRLEDHAPRRRAVRAAGQPMRRSFIGPRRNAILIRGK
jgi:peptidoglycan/LPS O-acetylase OafA/YrhL